MFAKLIGLVVALLGIGLLGLGVWLAALGGSVAYAALGIGMLVTAWYIMRGEELALTIYAALMVLALGWAVWEVGFDWWQLGPRGGLIVIIGLLLWLPAVRRGLRSPAGEPGSWVTIGAANVLCIGLAVFSMFQKPHEINGSLSAEAVTPGANLGGNVPPEDWHQYGRTAYGQRYSPLDQITPANVAGLVPAWQYQTGDVKQPEDIGETTYQVTPIKVGNTLYICTPHNIAIALDAATGAEKWRFDANSGLEPDRQHQTCRGVTYWRDPGAADGAACAERIYLPTADARLIALDAANGQVCPGFGEGGSLHLEAGMPYNPAGYYYSTSPPVAVAGKIIIGGAVNDNFSIYEPSGVIRAFDVDTGALIWNWDSGNPESTAPIDIAGGETYTANSPNSWSVFSYDESLGLVYIPMGNQTPDQLGMNRSENVEKYATSIVALDIATGADRWVQQTVHHDLWDMDVPAQPVLMDLTQPDGAVVPALIGPTKQGDIWVLNRETGEPIQTVTEVPAPGGAIEGDFTAPTQPTTQLTFNPPPLEERNMWGVTLFDQALCRIRFHQLRYEGRYTPPSLEGSIIYPGNFGVFNWGSVAVDPVRQVMFGMPTFLPFVSRLVPAADIPPKEAGATASEQGLNRNDGAPYGVVLGPFLGPLGIPCMAPPWGYVAGADLRTGAEVYRHPNGTVEDMTPLPLPFKVGVPGIGGPIITAGGVAFLGAAVDDYLRGYDLTTGAELWRARLPAGGQSTPMTYAVDGKQYVIIVAGGHGSVGTKPGDYVMAFTLP
jgi:quinoprotein glucose dehydrogenase